MKKIKIISFGIILLITVSFLAYCFFPVINYDTRNSQHVNHLSTESKAPGRIFLKDRNGKLITDKMYPSGYYKYIEVNLDSDFVKSLIKIEDKNYYNHLGINILAKIRAFKDNLLGENFSGGSTITEQYVKNKYFKDKKRTYLQKLREAILALYFSITRDKNAVLNIYCHDVYFGNNIYGLGGAIEVYFGKEKLEDLTKEEIVILLSLIHNPSIKSLEEKSFIEYFEQIKKRLDYNFERTYFGKLPKKENIDLFPFVTQNWMKESVGEIVTIDSELQSFAKAILDKTINELSGKNVTNGAIFAMNPKTREVLIYQGSKDFYAKDIDGQVDVIQSLRQPGSTMKPFLYLMALENGANPDDLVIDIENEYNSFQKDKIYISENYSLKEYGLVRFKQAIGNSLNNASVRLAFELGLDKVYNFYKSYGFKLDKDSQYYGYSLVLGNPSIKLEDLVRSYSELLPSGDTLSKDKFLLYQILSDPDNRDISFGVNSILNTSIPQAVKTGTSSEFRDNLIVSYHPDFVIGIWLGNNDNSSMKGVTGITGTAYIWHQIIEKAIELGYIKDRKLEVPEGIESTKYCLDKDCFRKEIIYQKTGKKYYSNIADRIYDKRDLFEKLSNYELNRLIDLGFEVR